MNPARDILRQAPVVPVLVIDQLEQAVPLATALVEGGLPVLEVTLRTDAGLPAIARIAAEVPGALVGAGTVTNAREYVAACEAGSRFVVSPGVTDALLAAAGGGQGEAPLIPGVATVSELMRALDAGIDCLKFFPAEVSGGPAALRAFAGPFPQVAFCPTGGIGLDNLQQYLALDNVLTVGGSWLTPKERVDAGDWDGIRALAVEAVARVRSIGSE